MSEKHGFTVLLDDVDITDSIKITTTGEIVLSEGGVYSISYDEFDVPTWSVTDEIIDRHARELMEHYARER
jgi:hypothetical protein